MPFLIPSPWPRIVALLFFSGLSPEYVRLVSYLPLFLLLLSCLALPLVSATASQWSWLDGNIPEYGEEPIRRGKSVRLGGYTYTFPNWTGEEKIQWVGETLDIWSYDRFYNSAESLSAIRSINPAICLLDTFVPIICDGEGKQWLNVGGFDNRTMGEWVLRKADGTEAPNHLWSWGDTHAMDIGNDDWADYFRTRVEMWVQEYGGDGYFLDGVPWEGVYYFGYGYDLEGYKTPGQVNDATIQFLDRIRSPNLLVFDDQPQYERAKHFDGIWDEAWMVYDSTVPWPWQGTTIGTNWEKAVEHLERHSRNMTPYIAQGWYHYGDEKALEFMVASYLLGKQSNSATFMPTPMGSPALPSGASYDLSSNDGNIYRLELGENARIFGIELGPPLRDRVKMPDGIWVREFEDGMVCVNPSRYGSGAVELGGVLLDLHGNPVTEISLGPRTGAILVGENPVPFLIALACTLLGFVGLGKRDP